MGTNQYVDGTYLEKVKDWHVNDAPWKASQILRMIQRHDLAPNSVYDVGCGAGHILLQLQKHMSDDVHFCGYDISPQAIAIARDVENERLDFTNADYLTSPTTPPDLTLVLDVFEHVPDYLGFLNQLREKCKLVIFHIPLDIFFKDMLRGSPYMTGMREEYGHLHHFTEHTALATLRDAGFEVIDYFHTDDLEGQPVPRNILGRMSYELRRLVYRVKPILAASVFIHFNLLVLARGDRSGTNVERARSTA